MKILIISTCQYKIHENEFVMPIVNLIESEFYIVNYKNLKDFNFNNYDKIIITGTALKDFDYLNYIENFNFIENIDIPILGICAGFQIIGNIFGCKIEKSQEIGFVNVEILKNNLLFKKGIYQTYCLHNNSLIVNSNFEILGKSENSSQVIKHNKKKIYAILFHPEVRNKNLIINFIDN